MPKDIFTKIPWHRLSSFHLILLPIARRPIVASAGLAVMGKRVINIFILEWFYLGDEHFHFFKSWNNGIDSGVASTKIAVQYFLPFASLQGPPAKHQRILIFLENWISTSTTKFINTKHCKAMVFMMVSCRISSTSLNPKKM